MAGSFTLGWSSDIALAPNRQRWNVLVTLAAALLLTVQTAAGLMQQARLDGEPAEGQRGASADGSSAALGRESVIGAFTGAPYTYPSAARIHNPNAPSATDFTIDPVNWYTDPFKSPIYYGVRLARWFTGGAGTGIDFIHSKAIAPLDEEAGFSGTLDGQPLPARARIRDIVSKLEFSHGHNLLLLNGFLRLPGIGPRVSPYLGAGAGVLLPHTEVELANGSRPRTYEYNYAGPAGQALLGVEIRLSKLSFFVEYKFTYGHYGAPLSEVDGSWLPLDLWRQLQRWLAGSPPPGGHISTEIASHQVVGGIAVRLAPGR
jgi:lipid A oxidase